MILDFTKGMGNSMKKFIIPIIAAAILGVGVGVTTIAMNRANVANAGAPSFEEVEVKSGNYYLNGDADSCLWIVVTPETISLKGDDIDASLRAGVAAMYEKDVDELDKEFMQDEVDKFNLLYCEEKPYYAYVVNTSKTRCVIHVNRHNEPVENREDLRSSNAGFCYDDTTDTIHLSFFGDFTLVE